MSTRQKPHRNNTAPRESRATDQPRTHQSAPPRASLAADLKAWWKGLLAAILLWAAFSLLLGTPCLFRLVLGIPCPFCGMTRAAYRLLCLDVAGAWAFQPMLFPTLAAIGMLLAARYGSRKLLPAAIAVTILCFCGCVLFYAWNMATVFPNAAPYTYDTHNLLRFLWEASH